MNNIERLTLREIYSRKEKRSLSHCNLRNKEITICVNLSIIIVFAMIMCYNTKVIMAIRRTREW